MNVAIHVIKTVLPLKNVCAGMDQRWFCGKYEQLPLNQCSDYSNNVFNTNIMVMHLVFSNDPSVNIGLYHLQSLLDVYVISLM